MMPTGDNEHGERTPHDSLGPNPTSKRSPRAADDVTRLAHELSNLLDGSMRWLAIADRNLARAETDPVEAARRQLDTVRAALVRMADLVNAALRSKHLSLGSPMLGGPLGPRLGETIEHAVAVMMPRAEELGVMVELSLDDAAGQMPSGPMYSVVLNGLVNALDAIEAALAMGSSGGLIEISSQVGEAASSGRRQVTIEIADDGIGLPAEADRVFQPNYSTKPGVRGIGLAVCASIAHELGGTIALTRRPERAGQARPGAVLRVSYPELARGEHTIGGQT
ncbi:MAG: HAMP domain-containing histidine kinase [Phycisphaeraceae bacterium]|nr:HAMP domain-containing histidine kinase [Phycisphaeraceae bacterium]MCW5763281.1 HAMP domain-containing histidine kinase [Phycisphaeraceae bacterium]